MANSGYRKNIIDRSYQFSINLIVNRLFHHLQMKKNLVFDLSGFVTYLWLAFELFRNEIVQMFIKRMDLMGFNDTCLEQLILCVCFYKPFMCFISSNTWFRYEISYRLIGNNYFNKYFPYFVPSYKQWYIFKSVVSCVFTFCETYVILSGLLTFDMSLSRFQWTFV